MVRLLLKIFYYVILSVAMVTVLVLLFGNMFLGQYWALTSLAGTVVCLVLLYVYDKLTCAFDKENSFLLPAPYDEEEEEAN